MSHDRFSVEINSETRQANPLSIPNGSDTPNANKTHPHSPRCMANIKVLRFGSFDALLSPTATGGSSVLTASVASPLRSFRCVSLRSTTFGGLPTFK